MLTLLAGLAVFVATSVLFRRLMPRDGKTHRLVGTEWEPYVAVAFCAGFALSFTMILSAVITLASTPN
jgi:hypothetical protein